MLLVKLQLLVILVMSLGLWASARNSTRLFVMRLWTRLRVSTGRCRRQRIFTKTIRLKCLFSVFMLQTDRPWNLILVTFSACVVKCVRLTQWLLVLTFSMWVVFWCCTLKSQNLVP